MSFGASLHSGYIAPFNGVGTFNIDTKKTICTADGKTLHEQENDLGSKESPSLTAVRRPFNGINYLKSDILTLFFSVLLTVFCFCLFVVVFFFR